MKTNQKVFVAAIAQYADSNSAPYSGEILWPGGAGWLEVLGNFTGTTGNIAVGVLIEGDTYQFQNFTFSGISPHPDFPSNITAAGIYKFSSPPSLMRFNSPSPIQPGDSITDLYIRAIRLDSYRTRGVAIGLGWVVREETVGADDRQLATTE